MNKNIRFLHCVVFLLIASTTLAQPYKTKYKWTKEGNSYFVVDHQEIVKILLPSLERKVILNRGLLTPKDSSKPLTIEDFVISEDENKILIYTNSQKVWRYNTRGDYWLYNRQTKILYKLGKGLPAASLMFAKLSPDGEKVAYSSKHNMYVEDIASHKIIRLTSDGADRIINGTFDWVYEEEFGARDGFRWSPDSKKIAFWHVDARNIRNYLMINNTDSLYPFVEPVEYPVVGQKPSAVSIGIVDLPTKKTIFAKIPDDNREHYLPRMEWADNDHIVAQQLDRKQQISVIYLTDAKTGIANILYKEQSDTWIDIKSRWHHDDPMGWDWIENGKAFLWVSEKDGWRHIWRVDKRGKETLITKGDYDILELLTINEQEGYVYFLASPDNATQQYLYRTKLNGTGNAERLTPADEQGTNEYDISPSGKFAEHIFSNANTLPDTSWINLATNTTIGDAKRLRTIPAPYQIKFIHITTDDNVTMDASITYPLDFDSTKKYPVVFYVYTEPGGCTVTDKWGSGRNFLYDGDMQGDGYIYVSIDGRGTPAPKGAAWRHSIYKKVGILNIHDQYEAAKKIMQWHYVDTSRIAVWGWSGGGSTTLNLLFQHGDVYNTGIAVAPVTYRPTYDNIYEERYMGLLSDKDNTYEEASAINHAQGLQGNLLLIHGSGDDNVHYKNSELLINKLIKYNKIFTFMEFPNRTHAISEGAGTFPFLKNLYTTYLKEHCPPGGR